MRHRTASALAAFVVAAGSLVLLAAPASAADGPPVVGCTTGSSCMIELNYDVTYTGSRGGRNGVVVPPPPCIGIPVGDAVSGSNAIISYYGGTAPVVAPTTQAPTTQAATPTATDTPTAAQSTGPSGLDAQDQATYDQAQQLLNTHPKPRGEWYMVSGNPNASAAAQAECNNLPLYIWEKGKGTFKVGGITIPPETLAALAYGQLSTASLSRVTLNPTTTNVTTNLPTFVDVTLKSPARKVLSVTAAGVPYVWATAATPDGQAATVWAWVTGMSINGGSTNSTATVTSDCTKAHAGPNHAVEVGSRYSLAQMQAVGVGQLVDCGVTYSAPGTFNLTASVTWNACWAPGVPTTPGPPATGCRPVPGAQNLTPSTSRPVAVHVREIQSVNNG